MSLSSDCKKELCRISFKKNCCNINELAALYMTLGSLNLLGNRKASIQFSIDNATITKRIFTLLQQEFHLTAQIHYVTHSRFGGVRKCILTLNPNQTPIFLTAFGMMKLDALDQPILVSTFPKIYIKKSCCMKAFLRGVMIGSGILSLPGKGYRLCLAVKGETLRFLIAKCLHRFELPIKQFIQKSILFLTLTKGEHVIAFLALTGAHQTVIQLENVRVQREIVGNINRAINCDTSNLKKLVNASDQQIKNIELLFNQNILQSLPKTLQEIANVRLRAPDASLSDLGKMLSPPIGKSGVNHRMRRLMKIAENIFLS